MSGMDRGQPPQFHDLGVHGAPSDGVDLGVGEVLEIGAGNEPHQAPPGDQGVKVQEGNKPASVARDHETELKIYSTIQKYFPQHEAYHGELVKFLVNLDQHDLNLYELLEDEAEFKARCEAALIVLNLKPDENLQGAQGHEAAAEVSKASQDDQLPVDILQIALDASGCSNHIKTVSESSESTTPLSPPQASEAGEKKDSEKEKPKSLIMQCVNLFRQVVQEEMNGVNTDIEIPDILSEFQDVPRPRLERPMRVLGIWLRTHPLIWPELANNSKVFAAYFTLLEREHLNEPMHFGMVVPGTRPPPCCEKSIKRALKEYKDKEQQELQGSAQQNPQDQPLQEPRGRPPQQAQVQYPQQQQGQYYQQPQGRPWQDDQPPPQWDGGHHSRGHYKRGRGSGGRSGSRSQDRGYNNNRNNYNNNRNNYNNNYRNNFIQPRYSHPNGDEAGVSTHWPDSGAAGYAPSTSASNPQTGNIGERLSNLAMPPNTSMPPPNHVPGHQGHGVPAATHGGQPQSVQLDARQVHQNEFYKYKDVNTAPQQTQHPAHPLQQQGQTHPPQQQGQTHPPPQQGQTLHAPPQGGWAQPALPGPSGAKFTPGGTPSPTPAEAKQTSAEEKAARLKRKAESQDVEKSKKKHYPLSDAQSAMLKQFMASAAYKNAGGAQAPDPEGDINKEPEDRSEDEKVDQSNASANSADELKFQTVDYRKKKGNKKKK